MAKTFYIKVKDGKKIRDPRNSVPLPHDRAVRVPYSSYWVKRLRDGDVELVDESQDQEKKPAKKMKKKVKSKSEQKILDAEIVPNDDEQESE